MSLPRRRGDPKVSFLIPAHRCPGPLLENMPRLLEFLSSEFGRGFEVILVPNPVLQDPATLSAAKRLARLDRRIRVCVTALRPGKGLALREGFGLARGRWIFTTDADMPFDLDFFRQASAMLRLGFHLVLGNRRLPESRFRMSKRVLSKIYPRFLIGLLFNLVVRLFFPIRTTDTQAGIKAMTRECADQVFRHQSCPHFSYDIEMILTAQGLGYRIVELPVVLTLRSEKSTIRILKTGLGTVHWLFLIAWRHWRGDYGRPIHG